MSVGATLSATDPVTILAIFNTYKVDPKLYTIIFGESILNDAIAIVLFETAQKYKPGADAGKLTILSLFESIGVFMLVSCISGIWLWWPLSGSPATGLKWKRRNTLNANLHYLTGFWVLFPLAMLSFTGAWISFPKVFGQFEARPAPAGGASREAAARARPAPWRAR